MWRKLASVGLVVSSVLIVGSNAASAGPGANSTEDGYTASSSVVWTGSEGGGSSSSNCTFQPAALTIASPAGEEALIGGQMHWLYARFCDGSLSGTFWIPRFTPADVLALARDEVERKLPDPTPLMIWPDPDFDWAYAQVPIDYRAEPGEWSVFEDTATAVTPVQTVSVTVRAEPAELLFVSGDPGGDPGAVCAGAEPLATYLPASPGACSYTYINASSTAGNGRSFSAALSISWDIEYWSTTDPGFAGTLPSVARQTDFPVEVAEVKTLGVAAP